MNDALLKSVREVRACEKHFDEGCERVDGPRMSAAYNAECDACLRLVLAHCGEKAAQKTTCTCYAQEACPCRRQSAAAIRREFSRPEPKR